MEFQIDSVYLDPETQTIIEIVVDPATGEIVGKNERNADEDEVIVEDGA